MADELKTKDGFLIKTFTVSASCGRSYYGSRSLRYKACIEIPTVESRFALLLPVLYSRTITIWRSGNLSSTGKGLYEQFERRRKKLQDCSLVELLPNVPIYTRLAVALKNVLTDSPLSKADLAALNRHKPDLEKIKTIICQTTHPQP